MKKRRFPAGCLVLPLGMLLTVMLLALLLAAFRPRALRIGGGWVSAGWGGRMGVQWMHSRQGRMPGYDTEVWALRLGPVWWGWQVPIRRR